jgi:hypothetical protein
VAITFGGDYKNQDQTSEFQFDPATFAARGGALEWLQKLMGGGMYGGAGAPDLSAIAPMIARLMGIGHDPNATERGGLWRADQATDMSKMVNSEANAFNAITAPGLRSQMAATGQGRSGALAEQIGLAGTRASVPLAQTQNQRLMDAARLYAQVGGAAGNRELGALGTAGQLGLGGINATNQYNIADLTSGRGAQSSWMHDLMGLLQPLRTGGSENTTTTGFNGKTGLSFDASQVPQWLTDWIKNWGSSNTGTSFNQGGEWS